MSIVHEHVLEPAGHNRAVANHPQGVADQIPRVAGSDLGQHLLVDAVDLGELLLDAGIIGGGGTICVRVNYEPGGPPCIFLRPDQVGLEPVDPTDEPGQQRVCAAAEVVALDRQPVDAVEQHREPLGRAEHRLQRVHPRAGPSQEPGGELHGRGDEQLVIADLEILFEADARGVGPGVGSGQQEQPLGSAAPSTNRRKRASIVRVFPVPAAPRTTRRLAITGDGFTLNGKQGI